jgi:hypothetical protein
LTNVLKTGAKITVKVGRKLGEEGKAILPSITIFAENYDGVHGRSSIIQPFTGFG